MFLELLEHEWWESASPVCLDGGGHSAVINWPFSGHVRRPGTYLSRPRGGNHLFVKCFLAGWQPLAAAKAARRCTTMSAK
jgi:hypothetical protein